MMDGFARARRFIQAEAALRHGTLWRQAALMYFWLVRPLALELAAGKVSERQAMHYYLASTLVVLAGTQYALWWGPRSGWLFHFELVVLSIAAIVGTLQCWKASGGSDFVFRAICLSVPAGLRVLVLSVAFGLALQRRPPAFSSTAV